MQQCCCCCFVYPPQTLHRQTACNLFDHLNWLTPKITQLSFVIEGYIIYFVSFCLLLLLSKSFGMKHYFFNLLHVTGRHISTTLNLRIFQFFTMQCALKPLSTNLLCWYSATPLFILNDIIFLFNNNKKWKIQIFAFCVLKRRLIERNCLIILVDCWKKDNW